MIVKVFSRWAREFLEAMNEDQKIKAEEHETRSERDLEKVKTITQKYVRLIFLVI